jgi:DNA-binding HxlR family transcriptional regulator
LIRTPIDPTEPETGCPLTAALDAIGGKWAMVCIYWMSEKPRRFNELKRLMPGVSHKVLTATLRDLEQQQLITRTTFSEMPLHVEYALSRHGDSVIPLLDAMRNWGRDHLGTLERVAGP